MLSACSQDSSSLSRQQLTPVLHRGIDISATLILPHSNNATTVWQPVGEARRPAVAGFSLRPRISRWCYINMWTSVLELARSAGSKRPSMCEWRRGVNYCRIWRGLVLLTMPSPVVLNITCHSRHASHSSREFSARIVRLSTRFT